MPRAQAVAALWFLLVLPVAVWGEVTAGATVDVAVDLTRPLDTVPPIWRFFGADEPNYATSAPGRRLLAELGALRPGQTYFRAHHMMTTGNGTAELKWGSTNLYTERRGAPVYDWSRADRIIDTYIARGLHPYLELGFMPQALSAAPSTIAYHTRWAQDAANDGKQSGWTYPPRDFERWAALVYEWTKHNVARYGRDEVQRWYFETWNEPDLPFYWSGTAEEFYRLHDTTVDAVRRALPAARVGGADVADAESELMQGFLKHISTGDNYATGGRGTPTSFLSFHAKGQPSYVEGHVRMDIGKQLQRIDRAFQILGSYDSLANVPVIIGENDPEGCAACAGPQNAYRNSTVYSSYTAALYPRLWALARQHHVALEGALTWSFTFVGQPWFAGYRQLATQGVDLPIMNVFRLFSRLGTVELAATSSGQHSLGEVLKEGVRAAPDIGVFATCDAACQRYDVLIWNYHDDDIAGAPASVRLEFAGRDLVDGATIWRVDSSHGDAYSTWRSLGSPMHPSRRQRLDLRAAARLHPEHWTLQGNTIELQLPSHGVAIIETAAVSASNHREP